MQTDPYSFTEKNAKKLTRMLNEKCEDYKLDLGDKVKRINKGNKPNHAILFIADASYINFFNQAQMRTFDSKNV